MISCLPKNDKRKGKLASPGFELGPPILVTVPCKYECFSSLNWLMNFMLSAACKHVDISKYTCYILASK